MRKAEPCWQKQNCLECPVPIGQCPANIPENAYGRVPLGVNVSFVSLDFDKYMALKRQGYKQKDICKAFNVGRHTLSKRFKWLILPQKGEVVELVKEGKTQTEIANYFCLSEKTLRKHGLWPKSKWKHKLAEEFT